MCLPISPRGQKGECLPYTHIPKVSWFSQHLYATNFNWFDEEVLFFYHPVIHAAIYPAHHPFLGVFLFWMKKNINLERRENMRESMDF